ncbi:MAG TPA: FAD:protein FMN transferase [Candidatus Saccharimonadia bacterium]
MITFRSHRFEAIGTYWVIEAYEPVDDEAWADLLAAVAARIEAFDQAYSRFRPDSLVTTMAATAGTYQLPTDAAALFELYRELYEHTGGAMTPLIGGTLAAAGYDANYSLMPAAALLVPPAWDDVMAFAAPNQLTLHQPALLDVGAAGKGYLADLVGEVLEAAGLTSYCVDAGGDIRYRLGASEPAAAASEPAASAAEPLRVGLEHPADPTQVIGVAELSPGWSICGSAGNRRAWAGYHHIVDPRTLQSPRHLAAVWVTARTTLLADALTTALFFVAPDTLRRYYEFEFALVRADMALAASPGFSAAFFTADQS